MSSVPEPGKKIRASTYEPTGSRYEFVGPPHSLCVVTTAPVILPSDSLLSCSFSSPPDTEAFLARVMTLFMTRGSCAIQFWLSKVLPLNSSWNTRFQLPLGPRGCGVADAETVVRVDVVVDVDLVVCVGVDICPEAGVVGCAVVVVGVGVGVGAGLTPPLWTLKRPRRVEVMPSVHVRTTLMVWVPSASLAVLYGRAVPSAAVPAKSKGAFLSVRTGGLFLHCGLSM